MCVGVRDKTLRLQVLRVQDLTAFLVYASWVLTV